MVLADPIAPGDRRHEEAAEMLPNQRLKTTAAAALALSAIAAPAAAAKPLPPDPIYQPPKPGPTIVRVNAPSSSGFDWGDAGIGAAGGLALAMLGIGGGLAISQRRERRSGASTRVASTAGRS
jgi:hypothetical protein